MDSALWLSVKSLGSETISFMPKLPVVLPRLTAIVFGLLLCLLALGCSAAQPSSGTSPDEIATLYRDRPKLEGRATVRMQVKTRSGVGTVDMLLEGDAAPMTAGNFAQLAGQGFYDGLNFHRVVKEPLPFVVQGGDPLGDGTGGFMDPETRRSRQIPLEIAIAKPGDSYELRYNELLSSSKLVLPHLRGAVAMARSTAPNSASSQFYIALSDVPQLDGRYAVFGYVTAGMDVVDEIAIGDPIVSMTVVEGLDRLSSE